ncbi:sensor histidine kinase [Streptomyces sp. NPDC059385]|uniref:sensor histidine kinase n=1 Tax=Streptomyces sp. NPDC059385 TaxID=3346817 RepID=UPI003691FEF8
MPEHAPYLHPPTLPLAQRTPQAAWTALAWGAVTAVALLLYATMAGGTGTVVVVGEETQGAPLAAMTVAMATPLRWAWRRPGPVLAVVLAEVATATALALRTAQTWPVLLAAGLLVGLITATRARRAGLAAAAACLAVLETALQVDLFRESGWGRVLAPGFLGLTASVALAVLFSWLAGTSVRQRGEYARALHAQAAVQAVTAERLRIARELHDMVAHGIGVIAIQAGAGRRVIDSEPERARTALASIETTSRETLGGLRRMLDLLRQAEPDRTHSGHPAPFTGLADLDRLVASTTDAGVEVEVRRHGKQRPLPTAVDRSAFRIVQESVTNVVRHAGTRHCSVSIEYRPAELRITVVDDGQGPSAPAGESGYGIRGMRERVALLDGRFTAGPRPGGGFRVAAFLPLPAEGTDAR